MIIKDPVTGEVRLIAEQVTKNALDINDLKRADNSLDIRVQQLEAGSNLGGANLVRFAFTKSQTSDFYKINTFTITIPSDWQEGNFVEFHNENILDIPAYGYIVNGLIELQFLGDYTSPVTELLGINTNTGTKAVITNIGTASFNGTSLLDIDSQTHKNQIVNILTDLDRGGTTSQYVSFDLNSDGIWSWIYIGASGRDGQNGTKIFSIATAEQLTLALSQASIGDIFLFGASNLIYPIGDLQKITALTPLVTYEYVGNILGPQGIQGVQGIQGEIALTYNSIITINEDPKPSALPLANFNRLPIVEEYFNAPWINSDTNKSYICVFKVDSVTPTGPVNCLLIAQGETTGEIGPQGIPGQDSGDFLRIKPGIYTPANLPDFATTTERDAFIVSITSGANPTYDLYIHAVGGTAYTIVHNWGGVPGPAPKLTILSNSLPAGSASYVTSETQSDGSYKLTFHLASGKDGAPFVPGGTALQYLDGRGVPQATGLVMTGTTDLRPAGAKDVVEYVKNQARFYRHFVQLLYTASPNAPLGVGIQFVIDNQMSQAISKNTLGSVLNSAGILYSTNTVYPASGSRTQAQINVNSTKYKDVYGISTRTSGDVLYVFYGDLDSFSNLNYEVIDIAGNDDLFVADKVVIVN